MTSFLLLSCAVSSQQPAAVNQVNDNILRFKKYSSVDHQGTGIEAFSFLLLTAKKKLDI